jgi:Icc-related predicted phosphoesterase
MQDDKENDFTKTLKDKFIDFVHGHVILGNITDSITKEEILDNLKRQYAGGNFELLDKVIASSLDKENLAREEADALSVHSFDDFKEMMEAIYKNYETKIKQEHIKSQVRNPSTLLAQARGATIAKYSHGDGARL